MLDAIREAGHKVVIIWYYEADDDELLDIGEKYRSIYKMIEFELIPY